MGWFVKERRGPAWKRGWLEDTLLRSSPPPLELLTLLAIISLFLFLSSYPRYKYEFQNNLTFTPYGTLSYDLPIVSFYCLNL
ncbi:unnamed protein product [Arabis nemorensis]|uniref:Uncharacterized protein n=1 Tax=Arabis nemorensis TaxID=586526 RepID=A0A565C3U1_9BRAS|nr:unnamed protein product [Arabis nemorensis]